MPKYRIPLLVTTLLASLGLAVYAYVGNFTRMLADDFCSMYYAERLGLMRSMWFWYLNWSGRYTAYALDWLILKSVLGPYKLHYLVPVSIFFWSVAGILSIQNYLQKKSGASLLHSITLTVVFLWTIFMLSPNIPQSLFWWNGMRSYALPLIGLTVYMLVYQILVENQKINRIWKCILGFILPFLIGGMGETAAVAQAVFIIFLIGLYILKMVRGTGDELLVLYSGLAGAMCSIIIVILSPGNAIRQSYLPLSPNMITIALMSLQAYGSFISDILFEPAAFAGLTGACLTAFWIGRQYSDHISFAGTLIPACVFGGIVISFACFPPAVYGYSEPPPTRTLIIPVFFLVAGLLTASFLAGCKLNTGWADSRALVTLSILLVGISVFAETWNVYQGRQVYIEFAQKWDAVDSQILQAKSSQLEYVNIPAMDNWAGLERPNDNPKYWPTLCYSLYYDIQVVGPPYP